MKSIFNLKLSSVLGILMFSVSACDLIEYSPNQIVLDADEKDLNKKNIDLLQARPERDTLKFVLMGDTQRFYDEADKFVKSVNQQDDLDFVIHAGDISDFGLAKEFKWVNDIMKKINVPYVTVVGNHDLIANGPKVYKEMFGPLNFSFIYSGVKFIFYDSNAIEYAYDGTVPDLNWIEKELKDTAVYDWAIPVSHIPPYNPDTDLSKEVAFVNMLALNGKVNLSLHGHEHSFSEEEKYGNGITYLVSTTVEKKGYAIVTYFDGGFSIEKVYY